MLKSPVYDRLKWVALVLLPALATLYASLSEVWHFPAVTQVVGTITLVDTFLGVLLGKSSKNYRDLTTSPRVMGSLVVYQDYDGTPVTVRIEPDDEVPIFDEGQLAAFTVRREPFEEQK